MRKQSISLIILRHLRIYGITYVLTFASQMLIAQVYYIVASSLILIALMGLTRPFEQPTTSRLEIANEFVILVLISQLLCQTDLVTYPGGKHITGWAIIVITSLTIVVNFGYILYKDLRQACRRFKFWQIRRRKIKDRQKVADRHKQMQIQKRAIQKRRNDSSIESID